jgi:hypothetical protein
MDNGDNETLEERRARAAERMGSKGNGKHEADPDCTSGACPTCTAAVELAAQVHADDPVDHPSHYTSGGVEVIDAIEAWDLGFHLGNAVKYIARAGKKDPAKVVEDLKKARWYLDRALSVLELGAGE